MNTAANPDSQWLFPGGRAGRATHPSTIRHRFQALRIPTNQARTAASASSSSRHPRPSSPTHWATTQHRAPDATTPPPALKPFPQSDP